MKTKLLILLGQRTPCCGAKIGTWHHGKFYCLQCEAWLREPLTTRKTRISLFSRINSSRKALAAAEPKQVKL